MSLKERQSLTPKSATHAKEVTVAVYECTNCGHTEVYSQGRHDPFVL